MPGTPVPPEFELRLLSYKHAPSTPQLSTASSNISLLHPKMPLAPNDITCTTIQQMFIIKFCDIYGELPLKHQHFSYHITFVPTTHPNKYVQVYVYICIYYFITGWLVKMFWEPSPNGSSINSDQPQCRITNV